VAKLQAARVTRVQTQVEELPENRVRLEVEVPSADVKHAVEHAATDLAQSLRIPGFRKGHVPLPVLYTRVGKQRVFAEAIESHIGGWFWNAAARSRIRPIASPEYGYDLPSSDAQSFRFTATVPVQPPPELADWRELEVPAEDAELPAAAVDAELERLRETVAELVPVDGRPAQAGDTLVVDLVSDGGDAQRDVVVELGEGRLVEQLEQGLTGMVPGDTRTIELGEGDEARSVTATLKDVKEKVFPPLDDDLARSASEFETLDELRADIDEQLRSQIEAESESEFRQAAVDRLVEASSVEPSPALVEARARELLRAMIDSLERRGISIDTYLQLTGDTVDALQERVREEARRAVARELVLEAAADQLEIEVSDEELDEFIREQAELTDEEADETRARLQESGRYDAVREDLRMRAALDRIAADVKRIPADLARAREKLWTPGQERAQGETTLWTPGSKEPA
jgi:trigger factor